MDFCLNTPLPTLCSIVWKVVVVLTIFLVFWISTKPKKKKM